MTPANFRIVTLALLAGIAARGAAAEEVAQASPQAGRSYANAVCAQCHSIEAGAKSSPNIAAPPFASMVTSAKLTSAAIDGWLTSSHSSMPDFAVPVDKRADLIAYIQSLALQP